jgi:hypothetical protein
MSPKHKNILLLIGDGKSFSYKYTPIFDSPGHSYPRISCKKSMNFNISAINTLFFA